MKIRVRFRKWGVMKYVGHLDMMRYFQKAMRRAKIDICYSEGFSPHQIMSFAAPLGVGITSDGEYFDMEVSRTDTTESSLKRLNETMVDGVEVTGYVKLPDNAKSAMSIVTAADYTLTIKPDASSALLKQRREWKELIQRYFIEADDFTIVKKTKKSERTIDLKPLVYAFEARGEEENPLIYLFVSTGSTDNIKPELVLSSLCARAGLPDPTPQLWIHRLETYATDPDSGKRIPLLAMGQEITASFMDGEDAGKV